jgi:hypothetical protein
MSEPSRQRVGFIESVATFYYRRTPRWLLPAANRFVEPAYAVARRACEIALDLFPQVESLSSPGTDGPGLLVAGRGDVRQLFLDRTGMQEARITGGGRRFLWDISRTTGATAEPATLIEADRCYRHLLLRRGYVALPQWVLFKADVSPPWPALVRRWRKSLAENMRRVVKHGFSCRIERQRAGLREFYERMHYPYIRARYGSAALLASRAYVESVWERGVLLLVTRDGEDVGGVLISTATREPLVAFLGIKDADFRHVKRGAISALYCFALRWAKEHGYQTINFGHARPFLDDGLFRYKHRWGMHVVPSPRKPRTLFVRVCDEPRVVAFLRQPIITYDHRAALVGLEDTPGDAVPQRPVAPSSAVFTPTCAP